MKTKKNLFKKGIAALLAALILVSGSTALFTQGSTSQVAGGGETYPTIEIYNITPIDSQNCVA